MITIKSVCFMANGLKFTLIFYIGPYIRNEVMLTLPLSFESVFNLFFNINWFMIFMGYEKE